MNTVQDVIKDAIIDILDSIDFEDVVKNIIQQRHYFAEDFFTESQLETWAIEHGFIKKESESESETL